MSGITTARAARDDELTTWREHGWVLLDGLVDTDVIDDATADLDLVFPSAEEYHRDPAGARDRWLGRPAEPPESYAWPPAGPGFRADQHRWRREFPFPGSGALNRLCTHPSIVDFCERALGTDDLRIYQAQLSAKYAGETNYEQPMHADRNHSWLPARADGPWWHVEGFLYLSDVDSGNAPTHLVSVQDSAGRASHAPLIMPDKDPDLYAAEHAAVGARGSFLAYRPDVFHRGVDLTRAGSARFLLNVSFKVAGQDWVGFHAMQSRSTSPDWVSFAEGSTPRGLELLGFPPPGHPIWDAALLEATADRYPKLDLAPWRAGLNGGRTPP